MLFRSGSTHPEFTEFWFFYLLSVMKDGWWSLLFGEHHFLFRFWRRKLQEAGIVDMKLLAVCSTMTATAGETNLISKMFAVIACSALLENWSSITLVWEWREDCVWRECLVTRICTYTWTLRWSLVWFNEVLFCEVKSYSKSFLSRDCGRHVGCV